MRALRPSQATFIAAITLLSQFAIRFFPQTDPDMWWHMRTAEWMLQNRAWPAVDPFSYTFAGQPWLYSGGNWIGQLLVYGFHSAFGLFGLSLYVAIAGLIGTWLVFRTTTGPVVLRLLVVVTVMVNAKHILTARPNALSFLFAVLVVWILLAVRNPARANLAWWLPPIFVLWGNAHGGYPMGWALVAAHIAGVLLMTLLPHATTRSAARIGLGGRALRSQSLPRWLLIFVLCLAAPVINPFGIGALMHQFNNVTSSVAYSSILEWQPVTINRVDGALLFGTVLITLLSFRLTRRPAHVVDVLWLVGVAAMAFFAGRNLPYIAVVAPAILSSNLRPAWSWLGLRRLLRLGSKPAPNMAEAAIYVSLSLALAAGALGLGWVLAGSGPSAAAVRAEYPVGAAEYVRNSTLRGRMYNSYNMGGYLIWALKGEQPVFVDPRYDVHGRVHVDEAQAIVKAGRGYEALLDKHQISFALIENKEPLSAALVQNPAWNMVYTDTVAAVFVRK